MDIEMNLITTREIESILQEEKSGFGLKARKMSFQVLPPTRESFWNSSWILEVY